MLKSKQNILKFSAEITFNLFLIIPTEEYMCTSENSACFKLNDICSQLIDAHLFLNFHEKIFQKIIANRLNNLLFWENCQSAYYQNAVLKLSTVYDADIKGKKNLGIYKMLDIIASNYNRNWKKTHQLDLNQLNRDKDLVCENKEPLVERLMNYRNKLLAHTDVRLIAGTIDQEKAIKIFGSPLVWKDEKLTTEEIEKSSSEEKPLKQSQFDVTFMQKVKKYNNLIINQNLDVEIPSLDELYTLIDRAIEICNRYRLLLNLKEIDKTSEDTVNESISFLDSLYTRE